MGPKAHQQPAPIASWHRHLLTAAAIFSVLLIAMGGILCVTQSIRSCPDWPGCFGRFYPPLEISSILEYAHRSLALLSALLILGSAIAGLVRSRHQGWIVWPPLAAVALLLEVSFFGARVVLYGLAAGWAAVDVGSALLVVALMLASAGMAHHGGNRISRPAGFSFRTPFARLILATAVVVYVVLVSGVLVSGRNSVTGCLGWPIYSLQQVQLDAHAAADALRLILSLAAIGMLLVIFWQAWRRRSGQPMIFHTSLWLAPAFLLEMLLQGLMLIIGRLPVWLLVPYTVLAAVFWGMLLTLVFVTGLQEKPGNP
jgi:cytochrome c oxidase assembly protein subunit 15